MPLQLLRLQRFGDDRGWFAETYNHNALGRLGIDVVFCQDNHSMSRAPGVLRGLHFQTPPHAQAKLVRCVRGRLWDVAVDIRAGSPTFGAFIGIELSADDDLQLFVPVGFAHGFVALEADTEMEYKVSDFYDPGCEGGLIWNDPDLGLPWPLPAGEPILSDKDRRLPTLAGFKSPFAYDGVPLEPLMSSERR